MSKPPCYSTKNISEMYLATIGLQRRYPGVSTMHGKKLEYRLGSDHIIPIFEQVFEQKNNFYAKNDVLKC